MFTDLTSSSLNASVACLLVFMILPFYFFLFFSFTGLSKLFSSSFQTFPWLVKYFVVDNAYEIFDFFQKTET